jgi:hypothetical protein
MRKAEKMTEPKAILIVPQRLRDLIDSSREDLSRADFIELCINQMLEAGQAPSTHQPAERPEPVHYSNGGPSHQPAPVSRQEFEAFTNRTKELQRLLIDFFLEYGLRNVDHESDELQERFKRDVEKLLR